MTWGFGKTRRAAAFLLLFLLCGTAAAAPQIGPPIESKFNMPGSPHGELVHIEDELSCHVQSPFVVSDHFGVTAPVILDFENRGEARTIEVLFRSYGESNFAAVFNVPPGESTRHFMYLPSVELPIHQIQFYDYEAGSLLKTISWSGVATAEWDEVNVLTVAEGSPPSISNRLCFGQSMHFENIDPGLLPNRWTGLTGVDFLVVTHDTWASPRMKGEPVLDWISMGGYCLLVDMPEEEKEEFIRDVVDKVPLAEVDDKGIRAGMGRLRFVSGSDLTRPLLLPKIREGKAQKYAPSFGLPSMEAGEFPFLVILLFLMAFAVLAGPVAWWYTVNKRGKPLLFFILTPLLSLCAIAVIVAVDLLKHGITPSVHCIAAEVIDQNTRKRITLSEFSLYCPFTVGLDFKGDFSEQPYVYPKQEHVMQGVQGFSSENRSDGVIYRNLILARDPGHFAFERILPERRRLEIRREGDRIIAENHLGAPLCSLIVCCDGAYARIGELDVGESSSAEIMDLGRAKKAFKTELNQVQFTKLVVGRKKHGTDPSLTGRWLEAFEAGKNSFAALRMEEMDDLVWVKGAGHENSLALVMGIF